MRQFVTWFVLFVGAIVLVQSCTDPTAIGATILEEDLTQLEFFDTVSLEARTVESQAVTTYAPLGGNFLTGYPSGRMRDPIFGSTDATVYFQVLPIFTDSIFGGDSLVIDSVILSIPFTRNNFYGQFTQEFGIQVSRIAEQVDNNQEYRSDQSFLIDPTPLVDDFRYQPSKDTVRYLDYSFGGFPDTIEDSQLRIPLSIDLGTELLGYNTLANEDRNLFWEQFPGLALTPTTTNAGMSSFNLIDNNAGIYIYYTVDSINFQYQLNINNPLTNSNLRYVQFQHDYTGTIVGEALAQSNPDQDSIFFLQGMAGPSIRLSFPNIAQLRQQNFVINKAELEIRVASLDQDSSIIFTPSDQILVATQNEDGEFIPIFDYAATSVNRAERFGGFIMSEPDEPDFYTMNISAHLQDVLNGSEENELFIVVAPIKSEAASRLIVYGPNHPKYPIKLRLAGTVLD